METFGGGAADEQPPYVVRAALGLWCALAVFLLVQSGLSWTGVEWLEQRLVEQQGMPAERASSVARSLLLVSSGITVLVAASYVTFAWMLWRGRAWARIAVTVLAIAHVLLILVASAVSVSNVIVLLLVAAAWACCWRRSTTDWLTGGRA